MPEIVDNIIIIEDSLGSKVEFKKLDTFRIQMTVSGHLITGGPRRTNIKRILYINHLFSIRDTLFEIADSEAFQNIYRGRYTEEMRPSMNMDVRVSGPRFRVGFDEGQFYIAVRNTVGTRRVVFQDGDYILREMAGALIQCEELFADFFRDYQIVERNRIVAANINE